MLVYCHRGLGGPGEGGAKAHGDSWFVDCTSSIMTDLEENLKLGKVIRKMKYMKLKQTKCIEN